MSEVPKVYASIAACIAALAKDGISKGRKNQQQGYSFRGIDDIYNALASVLATNNLCLIPRVLTRDVTERQTKAGSTLFYVVVDVEFDIVCAIDGSKHTARVCGEAMDSADKATNKAMSAAYKYMALQLFCIPTEGDNDADGTTHAIAPAVRQPPSNALLDVLAATDEATSEDVLRSLYKSTETLNEHERNEARKAIVQKRSTITKV